ncbi:MAG: bacterial Ig-like domain-containing protein [Christensenellales bacterium]
MKKLSKIVVTLALVLVLALPVLASGCSFGAEEGIKMHTPFKTVYDVGDKLDLTDGKIEYTDKDGKKTIVVISDEMVSGFDSSKVGTREMVITYENNTTLVEYTINAIDIEQGAIYYQTPFMLAQKTFDYGYLKFVSSTEAYLIGSEYEPLNAISNNIFQDNRYLYIFTKNIQNNKTVYTTQLILGDYTMDVTLTVLSETEVKFHAHEITTNTSVESTLTKYVLA